jgi:hypothetical protein
MLPRRSLTSAALPAPHSWDMEHWPPHVWPHDTNRARYIVRTCKTELIDAGALSRIGREFVLIGASYTRWLQQNGARAARWDIAPNYRRRPPSNI